MKYKDFVNTKYKPKSTEVVCEFHIEPRRVKMRYAAGGVAAESSIGTWTEVGTMKKHIEKLAAKVFYIRNNTIRIAYPIELFELDNMSNFLSSVAGNVFGLKELRNLRLNDVHMPRKFVKSFKGPKYGIRGVRKIMRVKSRPMVGTIIKPKLGLTTAEHAKVAYNAWAGGCDIVKDDENLASQKFNRFKARVNASLKARDKAEKETGERKAYMVNVTAETDDMLKRAKFVQEAGGRYVMVDVITVGWSGFQTLREENLRLILHGHRAMHAAITKNERHGISMRVFAKLLRVVGIDQLHVGTAVGKMSEGKKEVMENVDALTQSMHGMEKVMPVASGGLHPLHVAPLVKIFGKDVIIQFGGGIHGHPKGTRAGAAAVRQSLSAVKRKIPVRRFAREHEELKAAVKKWG